MAAHRAAIPGRRSGPSLIAATVILALTAISTQRAHGDAALQSSSPAAVSVLTSRPTQIELTFNEEAHAIGTQIVVEGPDGSATHGDLDVDATTVRQPLKADLPRRGLHRGMADRLRRRASSQRHLYLHSHQRTRNHPAVDRGCDATGHRCHQSSVHEPCGHQHDPRQPDHPDSGS